MTLEPTGLQPTDASLSWESPAVPVYIQWVLEDLHDAPQTVSSNWARTNASEVAAAASCGFITTQTPTGFGRSWRLTSKGLAVLERN